MKTLVLIVSLSVYGLGVAACGDKKDNQEPAAKTPAAEGTPAKSSATPAATPAKPAAAAADDYGFNAYAEQLLAAMAKKDKNAFFALALSPSDVKGQFDMMMKECPTKTKQMVGKRNVEDLVKAVTAQLGSDEERAKTYGTYLDECGKVADFTSATLTATTPKDVKLECGGGRADGLTIEVEIAGKAVFISVDDPVKTSTGWRAPEMIRCSTTRP